MALAEIGRTVSLPVELLIQREDNPRHHYDEAEMAELVASIKANGFIGSVKVRQVEAGFELLAGHRRRKAAILAGLDEVPAEILSLDDEQAALYCLIDNLHREDLVPWDEGRGYLEMMGGYRMTVGEVAAKAGKTSTFVENRMLLATNLGECARGLYLGKELSLGACLLLADLPDADVEACKCPKCRYVVPTDDACVNCGADLTNEISAPDNPQTVAARLCRGLTVDQAKQAIERVKEAYALGTVLVQTTLGFDVEQIEQQQVEFRSRIEKMMVEVTRLGDAILADEDMIGKLGATARKTVASQAGAAMKVLARVRQAAEGQTSLGE